MKKNSVIAIIVASGTGKRFSSKIPKQYLNLNNSPIIRQAVLKFVDHPQIDHVQVIINKKHRSIAKKTLKGLSILPIAYGGNSRQESVLKGLEAIKKNNPLKVLIHDAARPNISSKLISLTIKNIKNNTAIVPGIPLNDALIKINDQGQLKHINKNPFTLVQTPQGFIFNDLYNLHLNTNKKNLSDDSELFMDQPYTIKIINGDLKNQKVTFKEDLIILEKIMNNYIEISTFGYDVHKFSSVSAKSIKLGGIDIKFSKQLEGHSDADVVLHALADSLFASISKGDIGKNFPNNKKWKDANSKIFIDYALSKLYEQKVIIRHVDITIICEEPKISPYVNKMLKRIANMLNISSKCISIKATTTEGLGFTGRKEGIAVKCLITVSRPLKYND